MIDGTHNEERGQGAGLQYLAVVNKHPPRPVPGSRPTGSPRQRAYQESPHVGRRGSSRDH